MLKIIAATVLATPIAAAGLVASTGVMVVDVNPADGPHIIVPVPLLAAQVAAAFVPREARTLDLDDFDDVNIQALREVVEALRQAPDGELVRVEQRDELVVVAKRGDTLEITVDGDDDSVDVSVPLDLVGSLIDEDGELQLGKAIASLRSQRFSDLVEVHSGGDHVKVWVF
jgi:hypothetical protein